MTLALLPDRRRRHRSRALAERLDGRAADDPRRRRHGVGNAIAPIAVRERIPRRPALGTGAYTTGIQVGSSAAALSAVPLAGVLFGWRGALTAFSAVTCVLAIAWFVLTRDDPPHDRISGRLQLPFRSPTAWLLILTFGLMGSVYYGLNAWLADAYAERGWSDTSTGVLVAMMNIAAIPCSFVVPWLSERYGGRVRWLSIMTRRLPRRIARARRDPRGRLRLVAARRHRAGRHVRADHDAAARPRARSGAPRRARRDDARRRLHARARRRRSCSAPCATARGRSPRCCAASSGSTSCCSWRRGRWRG